VFAHHAAGVAVVQKQAGVQISFQIDDKAAAGFADDALAAGFAGFFVLCQAFLVALS
jgi:hypothetical protein